MEPQHVPPSEHKEENEHAVTKAALKSSGQSAPPTPRRAFRGRGAGRLKTEVPTSPDTNGAGSGRVLRDRSTRAVPVWRQSDLCADEDDEEELSCRRKPACPRRKRGDTAGESGADGGRPAESGESKDAANTRAAGGRQAAGRGRTPSSRAPRGSPRVVCKSEPETETACVETNKTPGKKARGSGEKKSEEEEGVPLRGEDSPFVDDLKDQSFHTQTQSDEEGVSSDDVPFRDDLNDQSYDPKSEREAPKQRRRAPPRHKEKKEKATAGDREKEREKEKETEVKTEGGEGADVKVEIGEGTEPPRKRGRRRKDDKSPRLPKRRKKPPVQYVRCEMEGCGTVLAHPRYLQHHIKYQHLMKKKYVCPHPSCGRLFRLQKQLLRHAKHHTDQRDYICEFCARAFKSSHNLAVHRMIHTGEKPLQCEICGFTCRQKASLNWHMKKHDADASYQFSCSICGKKFEKKDSVVAHKAKSHPEVLIAEALAANAGALITTPGALLEASSGTVRTDQTVPEVPVSSVQVPASQVGSLAPVGAGSMTHMGPVVVLDQDSLHSMQVPVTLALPSAEEEAATSSHSISTHALQTLPVQFVSAPASQQPSSVQQLPLQSSATVSLQSSAVVTQQAALVQPLQSFASQPQILHMTFRAVPQQQQQQQQQQHHLHQLPLLSVGQPLPLQATQPQQSQALPRTTGPGPTPSHAGTLLSHALPDACSSDCRGSLGLPSAATAPPMPPSIGPRETGEGGTIWEGNGPGENGNVAGVWEAGRNGAGQVMTDSSEGQMQHGLM